MGLLISVLTCEDTEEQAVQKYYWIEHRPCIPVELKAFLLRIFTASTSLLLQCATFVPLYGIWG